MNYIFLFTGLLVALSSCAQRLPPGPETVYHDHQLGESTVRIRVTTYHKPSGIVFIKLHDNEETGERAALKVLEEQGGKLIVVENDEKRNVAFQLQGNEYRFDPNRIFSEEGRRQTLKDFKKENEAAAGELKELADMIMGLIPAEDFVIALHNNSNDHYSVPDYTTGKLKNEAKMFHHNSEMDDDDFVFTTEQKLFDHLKKANISVVLQDNREARDDGSLSVYCGRNGRHYANIEAQHGHLEIQEQMIRRVVEGIWQDDADR